MSKQVFKPISGFSILFHQSVCYLSFFRIRKDDSEFKKKVDGTPELYY